MNAMQASSTKQITVKSDTSTVFKYLKDLQLHHLWNPHLIRIQPMTTLGPGVAYSAESMIYGVAIHAENRVSDYKEGETIEIVNSSGVLQYTVKFTLSPIHDDTIVRCSIVLTINTRAFHFAQGVIREMATRELYTNLKSLKIAVEERLHWEI